MDKRILVDTDIIIKSFRGDKKKYQELKRIESKFVISVVTGLELLNGARSFKQLISIRKELKAYTILHFDYEISTLAFQLFSKYASHRSLRLADSLIAATALRYNMELYTDNKQDYKFITGLKLYREQ